MMSRYAFRKASVGKKSIILGTHSVIEEDNGGGSRPWKIRRFPNVQFVVGSHTGHDCTIFHSLSIDDPQSSLRSVEMYTTAKLTSSLLPKSQKEMDKKIKKQKDSDRQIEEEIDNNAQKRKRPTDIQTE
jgi:hypothetical protein